MYRRIAAVAVLTLTLVGCDALGTHVDVAARAGNQELSAAKLAEMMQAAKMPPRKDLALAVASLWVNYQLLAQAAARGDTLGDPAIADEAMWAQIAQRKLQKLQTVMQDTVTLPTGAALEKAYDDGELLAARHILFLADKNNLRQEQIDSVRRVAERIRRQLTPANFVANVARYSGDPGSKDSGGEYIFPAGQMVPEFEMGTRALQPGAISDPIQTAYGFHIILRETYPEAKAKFDSLYEGIARQKAESTWNVDIETAHDVKVKDVATATVRAMLANLDAYRTDRTVLATSRRVNLRASRVANWIAAFPPQAQIRQQLQQQPDSVLPEFVKSLMRNELLLLSADSAKIGLDEAETEQLRTSFMTSVQTSMGGLGILPSQLADSGGAAGSDRGALARTRVNEYMELLLKNEAQFVDVSEPVSLALRSRYNGKVNDSGLERAVVVATELQVKADSAANAAMPPSEVPMPGAPPAGTTPPPDSE
ncbi:MAG: peptidylprolyl isomerase [Gemmatimonadetes bacterium]|nr:peptidylprolyl isomerase [Gemmatimonadota bacterium]